MVFYPSWFERGIVNRYTYLFVWKLPDGNFETKYLEASNLQAAKDDFEKTFDVNIVDKKVKFKRVRG